MKTNLMRPDIYLLRDRLLKLLLTALGAGVPTEPTLGALDPADLMLEVSLSLVAARDLTDKRLTPIGVKHIEKSEGNTACLLLVLTTASDMTAITPPNLFKAISAHL